MSPLALTPFLRRSALQPGESLPSLLVRLTELNCYPRTLFTSLCFYGHTPDQTVKHQLDRSDWPFKTPTYERLADLTGIASDTLYAATIHVYTPLVLLPYHTRMSIPWKTGPNKPRLITTFYREFRSQAHAQFCPACLREAAYHRLIWTPTAITTCLRHRCLLLSRCPNCEAVLSIEAVVQTYCPVCDTPLTQAHAPSVAPAGLGWFSQQMLQAWFEKSLPPPGTQSQSLPPQPVSVIYGLLRCVKSCLSFFLNHAGLAQVPPDYQYARQLWAEEMPWVQHELNRLAFQALLHWPMGFVLFAKRLRAETFFAHSKLRPWFIPPPSSYPALQAAQARLTRPVFEFARQVLVSIREPRA